MRVIIIISVLLGVALCDVKLPVAVTVSVRCVHNGTSYHPGESFQPSPCEHCYCTPNGQPACAIADCFFTPCVDAVHDPTKCCPQCPNGPNCRYTDGTVIKKGEIYRPDANTMCQCPTTPFGFGTMEALCAMKAPMPTDLVVS